MSVYIVNILQKLKKCLIMISPKHSNSATIEGDVIDLIYVGELEIHTVLACHCVAYSVWPGPLPVVLYVAPSAEISDSPGV